MTCQEVIPFLQTFKLAISWSTLNTFPSPGLFGVAAAVVAEAAVVAVAAMVLAVVAMVVAVALSKCSHVLGI